MNKTKIICTIGPASEDKAVLKRMILAGMNVARLNFSHGSHQNFATIIQNIRTVAKELGAPVSIMQDIQGPKIRVGTMPPEGITLEKNQVIRLTTKKRTGSRNIIPINYSGLPSDVRPKDRILINDGLIELHVVKIEKDEIHCQVKNFGLVKTGSGINVPTRSIKAPIITKKDQQDIAFGVKHNVDYIALSFVKKAKNIRDLRALLKKHKSQASIIAKIERHEAITNIEKIVEESDGIMVARGDLGVEISLEQVPIVQKKIIHLANLYGKPVITATEVLQSMVQKPRATRAEISDAANAIFDHTDALMLSNETAIGKYPVRAVQTLSKVARSTEKEIKKHEHFLPRSRFHDQVPLAYALCSSAARLAKNSKSKAIVALTESGFTAEQIAKHRIVTPIIAISPNPQVLKKLQLVWGIRTLTIPTLKTSRPSNLKPIIKAIKKNKIAKKNDTIIIVSNASSQEKMISALVL